jgi:hypothetical protein
MSEEVLLFGSFGEEALKSINCKDEEIVDEENQIQDQAMAVAPLMVNQAP